MGSHSPPRIAGGGATTSSSTGLSRRRACELELHAPDQDHVLPIHRIHLIPSSHD